MPRRGYHPTPETIAKVIASRKANRDRLGSIVPKRRAEASDIPSYGADADYCVSSGNQRSTPRLWEEKWDL